MAEMNRREFTEALTAGVLGGSVVGPGALSFGSTSPSVQGKRPNFVFVCSDQHSGKYAGFAGHPLVKTPNLDRIARQGVIFSAAYCGSPLCVPGRSSMMTGMYPSDVDSFCNSTVYDGSHPTWGKRLRDAGYYCWAVGKQDMNPKIDMGFVEAGVDHGHASKPDITSLFRRPVGYRLGERENIDGSAFDRDKGTAGKKGKKGKPGRDEHDTATALKFLREESTKLGKPWVAFVGLHEPHPEWSGPREYFDYYLPKVQVPEVSIEELEQLPIPYQVMRHFKRIATPIPVERIRRAIAAYFSMISEVDENVGRIYRRLEETNQLENTVFIYTSDHGESLGEHGMWLKNNLYEGPARIPMLVSGPAVARGKTIDTPVAHVDLVATMLALSGLPVPKELRGTSLLPLVEGTAGGGPKFVYVESHSEGNPTGSFMVRKGDWKLIHFSYHSDCLFNLKNDPGEKHNLIDDPATRPVVQELQGLLRGLVDPETITERAFVAQDKVLNRLTETSSEKELVDILEGRLGRGQATILAKKLKSGK